MIFKIVRVRPGQEEYTYIIHLTDHKVWLDRQQIDELCGVYIFKFVVLILFLFCVKFTNVVVTLYISLYNKTNVCFM